MKTIPQQLSSIDDVRCFLKELAADTHLWHPEDEASDALRNTELPLETVTKYQALMNEAWDICSSEHVDLCGLALEAHDDYTRM